MMSFRYHRSYRGKIKGVFLDWAGVTVDFGVMAPLAAFTDVFRNAGVPISNEEARAPMGSSKLVHLQKLFELDTVRKRWIEKHDKEPAKEDEDRLYAEFEPLQLEAIAKYSQIIPGTVETVNAMRERGIKIGTSTGYYTEMSKINEEAAAKQGYVPDSTVCASDVPRARPYPFMCMQNMINLQISPVEACVKVDDTLPGVEEGLNAGLWTIGLAVSGNEVGLQLHEWEDLPEEEKQAKRERAYKRMQMGGAHYVVDTIADLMPCLDDIETRLAQGERP